MPYHANILAFPDVDGTFDKTYFCGVYLLMRGDQVVYVGQSKNIWHRVHQHSKCKTAASPEGMQFDQIKFIRVLDAKKRLERELQLIRYFNPPYNTCGKLGDRQKVFYDAVNLGAAEAAESREFRSWILGALALRGIYLPLDSTWQSIKEALEPFLAPMGEP